MTFPIYNSPIDTIEKLANEQANGKIQVIVDRYSSYYSNFKVNQIKLEFINEFIN